MAAWMAKKIARKAGRRIARKVAIRIISGKKKKSTGRKRGG